MSQSCVFHPDTTLTYCLQVLVIDSEGSLPVNLRVTVTMEIINNPPQFSSLVNVFNVSEGAADGSSVGTIAVMDESKF